MIRSLVLLVLALSASAAVQIGVDQPGEWANPRASHHGKHALGGVVIGGVTYVGARALGASRFRAWATATLVSLGAQVVYETRAGVKHGNLIDPVDMAWGTVGGSAAAGLLVGGEAAVDLLINRDRVAVGVAWRF